MDAEEWRDVPGLEGRYQASSLGRIKSMSRRRMAGDNGLSARVFEERVLKQSINTVSGHATVTLEGRVTSYVHRLVAMAFHGPPTEDASVCRHLDGDSTNNSATNLAWGTRRDNANDRERDFGSLSRRVKAIETDIAAIKAHLGL
jgi:hypothetical protein